MVINLNKLGNNISMIKKDIDEYEMAIYDVLSDIKNTFYYWSDGYTQHFFRNVDKEIQDADIIVNCLNNIISFLNNLKLMYFSVYQLQKDFVSSNNMIVSSNYYYIQESDSDNIKELKNRTNKLIEENEDKIASLISRLIKPIISNINFDNLELSANSTKKFIGMKNEMTQKILIIRSKYKNFKMRSDRIMHAFYDISSCYNSKNTSNLTRYIDDVINSIYILDNNLNATIDYMVYRHGQINNEFIDRLMVETYKIDEI